MVTFAGFEGIRYLVNRGIAEAVIGVSYSELKRRGLGEEWFRAYAYNHLHGEATVGQRKES